MKFRNPIIPGFHPDPSICRVGEDYYLVTSSFEYFPGVPVYHSRDMIHWRQIGHCLTRQSQLNLIHDAPLNYSYGIWAPTIRYYDGIYTMITTNSSGGGNFLVTATDPAGEWSEPVWIEPEIFDPSLFFDDDGKVYYTKRGPTGIVQAEIDVRTGKLLTPLREIVKGFCSPDIEGPHLYKIRGTYYLMSAEGGSRYGHMETIGRSRSPWGPFEPCPHNPILSHRHMIGGTIRTTGHGDLVEAHDGSWWLVFLATRHDGYDSFSHLGRETFLAPVEWTDDGWPVVNKDGTVSLDMEAKGLPPVVWPEEPERDDFNVSTLAFCWNFLRNPAPGSWSLTERPGWLRLSGSAVDLDHHLAPSFVGRRQEHFNCRAATLLEFQPVHEGEEAGLTVFMNNEHHYDLAITRDGGTYQIILRRRIGDLKVVTAREPIGPGKVVLEIRGFSQRYEFYYGSEGRELQFLGTAPAKYLAAEIAGTWTGVYLAMYACGAGKRCSTPADFDWFRYRGSDEGLFG